jgi:hypothetical protein
MTDLEKLTSLLTEFGIGFTIPTDIPPTKQWNAIPPNSIVIECEEGSEKIIGYTNFYTHFIFNQDGSFLKMGIWE